MMIIIKSLTLYRHPSRVLLPEGLLDYIQYRSIAVVCSFFRVVLPLLVNVKGSTGVHHLWARPCFASIFHMFVCLHGRSCPYIYIYIYILSSSCRAASTDIPDPLSTLLPIVHRLWQVFRATSRILTELLYVCSSWSSCFCPAICGGHRSISLMSWSRLLQQCSACLVRLTLIVFVMGYKWLYSWCLVGCWFHDLFSIARSIL